MHTGYRCVGSSPTLALLIFHCGRNIKKKEVLLIIPISKKEAIMLREHGLSDHVKMSSVTHGARGKRYWAVESRSALKHLEQYRKSTVAT